MTNIHLRALKRFFRVLFITGISGAGVGTFSQGTSTYWAIFLTAIFSAIIAAAEKFIRDLTGK